jgi:hypothetical protein
MGGFQKRNSKNDKWWGISKIFTEKTIVLFNGKFILFWALSLS